MAVKKLKVKKMPLRHKYAVGILLFTALAIGFAAYLTIARAETVGLYPGSCLGGWINTQNAQGRPSLEPGASADLFNESNSAVLKNTIAQIFCGSFNGNIPQDNEPKKVFLKFSWNMVEKPAILTASSTITITSENFASSTSEIIDQPSNQTEFILIISESSSTPEMSESSVAPENSITPEAASENQIATTSEPIMEESSDAPSSFWRGILKPARAQEASSTLENLATSTPDVLDNGEFLEVSYTLDSVNWTALGKINKNNWREAQFELPLANWADIQKVQIEIKAIPTVDEQPTVYLDGIWLEVEYETSLISQSKTASISFQLSSPNVSYSSYNRTPSGSSIMGPVSISVSVDSFDDFGFSSGCGLNSQSCDFWGIRVTNFDNNPFNSKCVSKETLSHTFAFDLPEGSYIEVMAYVGHTQESCERGGEMSKFLEGDSSKEIFTVTGQ